MVMRVDSGLRLQNDSTAQGEDWWEWHVWLEGPPEELAGVESVTYRLHPTFPQPVREVKDAATSFRLTGSGWGEFSIAADVSLKDGGTVRLERWLELGDADQRAGAAASEAKPSVFIVHSVADAPVGHALREALEQQGIEVWTDDQSLEPGTDWQATIKTRLEKADTVVPVLSNPPSRFVEQEAALAISHGRHVVPICVGNVTKVHTALASLPRFQLGDVKNVGALAVRLAAQVRDQVTPEENL